MTNIYDAIKEKENQIAILSGADLRLAGGDRSVASGSPHFGRRRGREFFRNGAPGCGADHGDERFGQIKTCVAVGARSGHGERRLQDAQRPAHQKLG